VSLSRRRASTSRATDWRIERDRIDLAAVARDLLGPAPGRIGERGRKLWWHCPFHDDPNPSFMVEPGKPWWKCWGCGEHGDAATLVMRLEKLSFPEAVTRLTVGSAPSGTARPRAGTRPRPGPKATEPPPGPSGMPEAAALTLVAEAEARLWSPEGVDARANLTGPRGLTLGTIRAARLGWTPGVRVPTKAGGSFSARGVVIPWYEGDRLALVKLRQPDRERPRYAEAFRDRPALYPGRRVIRPGRPVVVVEGEFDALLLGQELADLAAVVTLGGTGSTKPEPGILGSMLAAAPWFIATDSDDAGDRAAVQWAWTRATRVRPPKGKDWTHSAQGGIGLRRWWADYLGVPFRPYSWEHLAGMRWGPAIGDPTPWIIID
jgi:CHC2 zinc finger/Toprim-like